MLTADPIKLAGTWRFCHEGTPASCLDAEQPCPPCLLARTVMEQHEEIQKLKAAASGKDEALAHG